jgi:hypothetical protein
MQRAGPCETRADLKRPFVGETEKTSPDFESAANIFASPEIDMHVIAF